jgi:antitoxin (DNA-binding transcriptional repressor) of toxin-antitoxin stability system
MEKATISELKNRLSEYLKKVRAGHSVLIFDREQPIARLERVTGEAQGEGRLARLERAGLLRRAKGQAPLKLLRGTVTKPKRSVAQALLAEREEGR